jgi:hypothetical protein
VDLHKRLGLSDDLLSTVKSITEKKKMDPVDPKANQKDFDDRKDKDIDNDGDVDKTDKYLHRRRKAVTKAVKGGKDQVDTEPKLDTKNTVDEAVHPDHISLHPHPTKKNMYKVGQLGNNAKRHMKTGETVSDSEVDDLHDMGMKVKHEKKPMNESEKKKISKNYAKMLKSQGKFDSSKYTVEADGVADQAVDKHNCATHVYHEQFGEGQTIYSMHADPDEFGLIEWYDVMFEHGIEKKVPTSEMKVTKEMSHGNHKKKK